jgi:hypothetical protein
LSRIAKGSSRTRFKKQALARIAKGGGLGLHLGTGLVPRTGALQAFMSSMLWLGQVNEGSVVRDRIDIDHLHSRAGHHGYPRASDLILR